MRFDAVAWVTTALIAVGGVPATAGQELELHGFLQGNYSIRVADTDAADPPGDFLLGDQRLQLELAHESETGAVGLLTKVDLFHDAVDGRADVDVREAYITLAGDAADVRVGRQIVTWGVGDLVFINDVFTKDWTALIAGRPLQYLKVGSDGVNVNLYPGRVSIQAIAVPFFEPDRLPTGDRLIGYDPLGDARVPLRRPDQTIQNTEVAARVYGYLGRFDTAFYAYRGFWHSPPGLVQEADGPVRFHPSLSVYGASLQGGFASGVVSVEGGLYDSRTDRDGTNPGIENSQVRLLTGFQQPFGDALTLGAQYYLERMLHHDAYRASLPADFASRARSRHNVTVRLTRTFDYQTYQASVFAWVSPNEEDYYVNPELRYVISDEAWVAVGANLFGGTSQTTFFGQFTKNDNLYTTLRYSF